ncbi:resistance to homoserine/threonine (RhtB) family protein [Nonomuraea maritima]|uniref:Resistance to homoserine/threonine (RhtB) family protein n=1 Tax=Nonomuraea maritima TaxID=683260 RepID=A0A1G8WZ39_9ACTN|nr:LysE family translocator [Nonomuraea maritima]SDJ83543.1 resistance to homoserine/threonine (RhtB) family protein [Nonomuraea maritima]
MLSMAQIVAFSGVIVLGAMSPGPDFAVVVRRSAVSGRGHGMAAAAGIALGVCVWVMAAATGIAALLSASAAAFTLVKVVGAAYLGWLGIRSLRSALRGGGALALDVPEPARRGRAAAFAEGLLTNVLNPKAALFFVALVPQFVGSHASVPNAMMLAAIALTGTIAWFLLVATIVGTLRKVFTRPGVRRTVDALTGLTLIALGVRLAASSRP